MLPTLVIGLREGLEAALIVGIIAAFLGRNGRRDALRSVWIGVAIAVVICIAVGVALEIISAELPQAQQEGLETIIGLFAVVMVSYMVLWMSKHARDMKGELESAAGSALARGSTRALVAMAFLAVLREGFETAVFLLAVSQGATSPALALTGAVIGILIAVVIGYGIYRGGVRLNMGRFFKITGIVLVFVAAGLVMSALHTAHEAGWLNIGQATALDLSSIIQVGTPLESLFTGVLGIQAQPTVIEVIGWLVFCIPMLAIVLTPKKKANKPAPVPAAVNSEE